MLWNVIIFAIILINTYIYIYIYNKYTLSLCKKKIKIKTSKIVLTAAARFNKEVQPTLSLNLNSELSYSEMGNSEFSVTEQLNCVSLLNSK